jgi:hypothetical protein
LGSYPKLKEYPICNNNISGCLGLSLSQCTIYRNHWKYRAPTKEVLENEDDDDKDNIPEESKQEDLADLEDNEENDDSSLATPAMLEQESLMADATRHVKQAIIMREMTQECIAWAQPTVHLPHSERHYCFTVDYTQNMMLPKLGDTQPDDTYYFLPNNIYVFGIANNSTNPMTLLSYTYQEEQTGKERRQECRIYDLQLSRQIADFE